MSRDWYLIREFLSRFLCFDDEMQGTPYMIYVIHHCGIETGLLMFGDWFLITEFPMGYLCVVTGF